MFVEFSSGPTKKSYVATLSFSSVKMTDKSGKDKPRRNVLSRGKKSVAAASRSSASTVNAPPITSFFNISQPSMLPCPLCGQLVPKFRINEHIDLQCKKFERVDSHVNSVSKGVEPHQSSPERSPLKSTPVDIADDDEGNETKTSPYFKNFHQVPQEIHSKSVVRAIDLGSLSSKLSRRYDGTALGEDQYGQMCPGMAKESMDPLSSSQKENLPFQSSEEQDFVIDLTATSPEKQPAKLLCLETEPTIIPQLFSSFSKVIKRKKETTNIDHVDNLSKKAKLGGNEEPELSTESTAKMHKDHVEAKLLPINICDSISSSDEGQETGTSVILGNLPAVSEADKLNTDHSAETSPQQPPYYLSNFRTILQAVLENDDDRALFNQDDMTVVHAFEKLSGMAQKLYVRLFQRKLKWLQVSKLDYEEICIDLGPVVQDLVRGGFLESDNHLQDLEEALELLSASEVKALAKTFHLGSSGTQKQHLVEGLLRLSKQRSLFSQTAAQNNIGAFILKRAKQLASSCVRLCRGPRAVFSRVLLLFSLTDPMEEEEMGASGQSQLYTILLVKSGRLAFPDYTVERVAKVFQDRNDLIRYEASMRTLQEMISAMQTGQWEEALELYTNAKNAWEDLRSNHDFSHQKELPVFLRCFTTGWAYTRILSRGVEVLQRLRCYEKAVEELQSLLQQSIYCLDSRGRWWDRLALNLHQHLKKPEQAICAIRDGLSDPLVRTGHKLSLYQRAVRMRESASFKKYRLQLKELPSIDVKDVKHVTIRGQLFPHEGGMGKSRFLIQSNAEGKDGADATLICSVEELSLAHYRQQGFDQGIHGEGSTFSTLFALLLWDIIFMEGIPDVFRNPIQTCPLDFYTDYFYENRREALDSRIQLLNEASIETLHDMMEETWNSQRGKVCSCINWERFPSLKLAQSLVSCMGGAFLAGVIARMSKDYRHCRGGLPDLVVWNTSNNNYKLVEVKGPNDRLSQKQQIWLDELQKLGADVEVCHVVATGAIRSHLE